MSYNDFVKSLSVICYNFKQIRPEYVSWINSSEKCEKYNQKWAKPTVGTEVLNLPVKNVLYNFYNVKRSWVFLSLFEHTEGDAYIVIA